MVQWFGLHASNSWWGGVQVPSVIWEIRSHMLCGEAKKQKKKEKKKDLALDR